MVGSSVMPKRKSHPGSQQSGSAKKKRNNCKVVEKSSNQHFTLELEESYSHFELLQQNLKKRKRPSFDTDTAKDVNKSSVKMIGVEELDLDDGEGSEKEIMDPKLEILMSSSPAIECGDDDDDVDDVSENVKTEEVGASVKVENLDNMEVNQDVKKEQMNRTEEAKGWLTISSLPIGWKFREMSSPEAAGKVEFSTNKRQFFLAPTGKIFPSRCFHHAQTSAD